MFRPTGQNPSVDKLVYIPKPGESREYEHPVLRPGMDGFSHPPTLETIGPYNPNEDRSEVIPLKLAHSHERVHKHRWNQWPDPGYKNDPTFIDLEYRPGWREGHPNGRKELEKLIPYDPNDDRGREIEYLAESKDRSGLVGTQPQDERFIFVPEKVDPRLSEFEPFDIVRGEGGAPGDPYKGDGMPPYWPRPTPTPPAPKARMAGLSEAIAAIVTALS